MTDKTFKILIAKYLSGNTSPDETAILRKEIESDPEKKSYLEEQQELWNSSGKIIFTNKTPETSWKTFREHLNQKSKQPKKKAYYYSIASAIAIIIFSFLIFTLKENPVGEIKSGVAVYTAPIKHILPDSSVVWLGENSKLTLTEPFNKDTRELHLEGEAFFDVKRDESRPFIILTEGIKTRVLGTSFNVRAFPNENSIEIYVEAGRVSFSNTKNNEELILGVKESAVFYKNENLLTKLNTLENTEASAVPQKTKRKPSGKSEYKSAKEKELKNPTNYLMHTTTWKENILLQTVIQGELVNQSLFTSFKNVKIAVKYRKPNGKATVHNHIVKKEIHPGETVKYKIKLSDYFDRTDDVEIKIEEAELLDN
ncbi:MAG: FecR family protein [Cytophagaceae bacterium]